MAYRTHCLVCAGTGCVSCGSFQIGHALEAEVRKRNLAAEVQVVRTGCQGFCAEGPVLIVQPDDVFYCGVKEKDVPLLVEEHFLKGRPVKKLMYTPAGDQGAHPDAQRDSLLRQAEAGGAAQPGPDRSRAHRGLHRARRLFGARQGADRDDRRGDHPGDQALGAARARRRRVPHRHQVGDLPAGRHPPRGRADRRLQRRRGRPGRVHGSQHHRERSARGRRGHDHRRAGHRRRSRGSSTSGTSTRLRASGSQKALDQARELRAARPDILGTGFDFDIEIVAGSRRIRVRRVHRADGVARRARSASRARSTSTRSSTATRTSRPT